MTAEEAKRIQDELAEYYDLSYWYGVHCEKCCGVYPKIITGINPNDLCRFECPVCGKTTAPYIMPWLAEEAWNRGEFITIQRRLF